MSSRRPQAAQFRAQRQHRSQVRATVLKWCAAVIAVALVAVGGWYGVNVWRLSQDIAGQDDLVLGRAEDVLDVAPVQQAQVMNVLLVGVDSRTDAQGNPLTPEEIEMLRAGDIQNTNTDTIMVVRVDTGAQTVTGVSIPRDSYIRDRVFGNTKINAVYAMHKEQARQQLQQQAVAEDVIEREASKAGRQGLIEAVGSLTGVTIDHYAEVGLLGFVLLTDAVGGVNVCLNEAVDEPLSGARFPAGEQTLNGADGLSFVRQRYGLPRGDLDRVVRQQTFVKGLAQKVISAGTLANPAALQELMESVRRSVVTDDQFDVLGLAGSMAGVRMENISFETIPVVTIDGRGDNGESVVEVDTAQVHAFFQRLSGVEQVDVIDVAPVVRVWNATDVDGAAAHVAEQLRAQGVTVAQVGNSRLYGDSTQVVVSPDALRFAEQVGSIVGGSVRIDESLPAGSVMVVVGAQPDVPAQEPAPVAATANGRPNCVN